MSQRPLPNSNNPRHQRQEQVEAHQEVGNGFPHVHIQPRIIPFGSNSEVAELTWENGQLSMKGFGGLLNGGPTKPWDATNETLESIVHQATNHKNNHNLYQGDPQPTPPNKNSVTASSKGGGPETSSGICAYSVPLAREKRALSDFNQCTKSFNGCNHEQFVDHSACASANVTFDSLPSLRTKTTEEDSAYRCIPDNQCDDRETKTELTAPSHSSRKSRAAAVHNLSERRRRDRINQKLRTLQKLVPNACKTDKASMLDEVINYLKQLQTQVQLMSVRNITPPHMMLPLGVQQHLQKSLLMARMEMGMPGMSLLGRAMPESFSPFVHFMSNSPLVATTTAPTFLPHFVLPTLVPPIGPTRCNQDLGANHSVPLADPYCSFHAQSMNVDLYNKMVGLQQQRIDQLTKAASHPSQSNGIPK